MGTFVIFQWARAVFSPQFLSHIPSGVDRALLFSEVTNGLKLTTDLTSDVSCPALQGQWEDILRAQEKFIELLTKWQEEKEKEQTKSVPANNNSNDSDNLNQCKSYKDLHPKESVVLSKDASSNNSYKLSETVLSANLPGNILAKTDLLQKDKDIICKEKQINHDAQNVFVISNDCTQLDLIPTLSASQQNADEISMTVDNNSSFIFVTTSSVGDPKIQDAGAQNDKKDELYMDIVLASRKDYGKSLSGTKLKEREKIKTRNRENPLDKLCQLLKIDEEESISEPTDNKKFDESERRRRYEENMPFKYFCTNCSFKTKRENQFLKHLKLHEKHRVIYHCSRCQFTTIRIGTLRRHELQHNESRVVNCPKCPYKTDSLKFLRRHIQAKHCSSKPAFQCCQCDFAAGSLRELKKHRHVHNPAKPKIFWTCSLCSYKTQNKGHLQRHKNDVHELIRSYLCHHCGKSFKRHDTLKQHKITHGETGPTYTCSQCNKVCRSNTQLKEHMTVHTTQRPFLCELCGATFKTRSNQSKHIKMMHSAIKLVPCSLCKRTFSNKATMMRHQKTHRSKEQNGGESGASKSISLINPNPCNEELNNEPIDNLH